MSTELKEKLRDKAHFLEPLMTWFIGEEIGNPLRDFFRLLQGPKALEVWEDFKDLCRKAQS